MRGLVMLLAATLIACDSSTEPRNAVAGVYTLTTVDGLAVPATRPLGNSSTIEITSGTLTLRLDGTASRSVSYIDETGASYSEQFDGTYTSSGSTVSLRETMWITQSNNEPPESSPFTTPHVVSATVSNISLTLTTGTTLTTGSSTFVYQR